jgi:trimeric autotransporter adhesin
MDCLRWCGRYAVCRFVSSFALSPVRPSFTGVLAAVCVAAGCAAAMAKGKTATITTLAVTAASGPVTTVSSGTVVTLIATVTLASGTIKAGHVNFCDAAAVHCTDIYVLGTAQLTIAGKAILKLRSGIGSHSYKAVFAGTASVGTSSSSHHASVSGAIPLWGIPPVTSDARLDGRPLRPHR